MSSVMWRARERYIHPGYGIQVRFVNLDTVWWWSATNHLGFWVTALAYDRSHQLMLWRYFPSSTPRAGRTHLQASRHPGVTDSPSHHLGNRFCSVRVLHMGCRRAAGFPERRCGRTRSHAAALRGSITSLLALRMHLGSGFILFTE